MFVNAVCDAHFSTAALLPPRCRHACSARRRACQCRLRGRPNGQSFPVTAIRGYVNPASIDLVVYLDAMTARRGVGLGDPGDRPDRRAGQWPRRLGIARADRCFPSASRTSGSAVPRPPCCSPATRTTGGSASPVRIRVRRPRPNASPARSASRSCRRPRPRRRRRSGTTGRTARRPARGDLDEDDRGCGDTAGLDRLQQPPVGQAHDAHPPRVQTMKQLGYPRQLAFACWNRSDWLSVLAAEGAEPERRTPTGVLARPPTALAAPGTRNLLGHAGSDLVQAAERPPGRGAQHGHPRDAACLRRRQRSADELHGGAARARFRLESRPEHEASELSGHAGSQLRAQVGPRRATGTAARCRDGGAWDVFPVRNLG